MLLKSFEEIELAYLDCTISSLSAQVVDESLTKISVKPTDLGIIRDISMDVEVLSPTLRKEGGRGTHPYAPP